MRLILRRRSLRFAVFLCITPVMLYIVVSKPRAMASENSLKFEKRSWTNTSAKPNYSYDKTTVLRPLGSNSLISKRDLQLEGIKTAFDYCNSPFKAVTGQEGHSVEGFKLRNVHVFINHGDQTSVHRLPGHDVEAFNCKFSTWYTGSNEKFRRFPDQMNKMAGKQGRRNHFLNWALYPDRDICVGSVLTSRGALQHLKLGQHLFDTYSKHRSLFDPKLALTNQMSIRSTSTSRTYQSAVAFLYGFLPSFNISHSKIDHSQDLHFCTKQFSLQKSCFCKHGKTLKIRAEKFQNKIGRNMSQLRQHFTSLFELSDVENGPLITALAQAVIPSFCHNITMPCSHSESSFKCKEVIGDIWRAVTAREMTNYEDPDLNYLKYSSIVMTPVFVEIIHRMKNVIENRHTPKFVLYSGHDVTLSPLLYVLGLQDGRWPPYASRVIAELFENQNDASLNRFYLRFLYNGYDRTEDVVFCRRRTYKGLCNFNMLIEFVFKTMLKRYGFHSYYDACSR